MKPFGFLAVAFLAACAPVETVGAPGIPNFAIVAPGVYRGAQPTAEGFATLKERGVKTVISLRTNHPEKERVQALGMEAVEIPLRADLLGSTPPTDEQIRRFFDIVRDPSRRPVFFHCAFGKDRTGAMAALYRIQVDGWTSERAIEEMRSFGFHEYYRDLEEFVRSYKLRTFVGPNQ